MSTSENETNKKMHNLMNHEWTVPDINDRDDNNNKEDLFINPFISSILKKLGTLKELIFKN